MKEKFSDFEGGFLTKAGEFQFEIVEAELKDSKKGEPMWQFGVRSSEGTSTLYHSLNPKARWSLNNLVKACLRLDTQEKIDAFECDYELIGQEIVGLKFIGVVECEKYDKEVKMPQPDGTFAVSTETKDSFKIKEYKMITVGGKK